MAPKVQAAATLLMSRQLPEPRLRLSFAAVGAQPQAAEVAVELPVVVAEAELPAARCPMCLELTLLVQ